MKSYPFAVAELSRKIASDDPNGVHRALYELYAINWHHIRSQEALDVLSAAVHSASATVRRLAAGYLASVPYPQSKQLALVALLDIWRADGEQPSQALARAFGDTRLPGATDPLLRMLEQTKPGWDDFYVRYEVVKALKKLANPRSLAVLHELTHSDTQEFDAWGTGVGVSVAEVAQDAIDEIHGSNR